MGSQQKESLARFQVLGSSSSKAVIVIACSTICSGDAPIDAYQRVLTSGEHPGTKLWSANLGNIEQRRKIVARS